MNKKETKLKKLNDELRELRDKIQVLECLSNRGTYNVLLNNKKRVVELEAEIKALK